MIIGNGIILGAVGLKAGIRVTAKAGALLNLHYKNSSIILQSYQLGVSETIHTFMVKVSDTTYVVEDATNGESVEVLADMPVIFSTYIPFYGDGSLNTVTNGYTGKLWINGENWEASTYTNSTGNLNVNDNAIPQDMSAIAGVSRRFVSTVKSGTNSYSLSWNASEKDLSVCFNIYGLYSGFQNSNHYISNIKLTCDGEQKTLSELVSSGAIKPMVLIVSSNNDQWYFPSAINIYTGGSTGSTKYANLNCYFILNKGHSITALSFYSLGYTENNSADGIWEISADKDLYNISMRTEGE